VELRLPHEYQSTDELLARETANLAECAEPLVDLVDAMRGPGARTARIHYGARGWVVHTIHNVWGFTAPGQHPMWGCRR